MASITSCALACNYGISRVGALKHISKSLLVAGPGPIRPSSLGATKRFPLIKAQAAPTLAPLADEIVDEFLKHHKCVTKYGPFGGGIIIDWSLLLKDCYEIMGIIVGDDGDKTVITNLGLILTKCSICIDETTDVKKETIKGLQGGQEYRFAKGEYIEQISGVIGLWNGAPALLQLTITTNKQPYNFGNKQAQGGYFEHEIKDNARLVGLFGTQIENKYVQSLGVLVAHDTKPI